MNNNELENKIKQAFENATPDLLDAILQKSEQQKGKVVYMEQKRNKSAAMKRITSIAAALVLCVAGAAGYSAYANLAVDSVIELDVNPSIELEVNGKERVIAVNPLNEDAKTVIGDMDFKGSDVDVAINALIGSMLRNGYINDMANSILLSVNSDDPQKGAELQNRLSEKINNLLQGEAFQGAVLSQNITDDDELDTLAQQYGITVGKAKLVQQITAQNTTHTFDELAELSINELNLVKGGVELDNISSVGAASDKAYIGEAEARAIAFAHAAVQESGITDYEAEMDYERGTMVYEIEFEYRGREYEYDIEALTGQILWCETDDDDDGYRPAQQVETDSTAGDKEQSKPQQSSPPAAEKSDGYIDAAAAKAAALAHAGLSEAQVRELECEKDREDGRLVYEIEFEHGNAEYKYEIDAATGAVIKYDKEWDD